MDLDKTQPDLGYLPHVSPNFGPVDHSLPGYPAFLLLLTEHSDLTLIIVSPDPPLKPPALSSLSLRLWNTSINPLPDIHQAPPWLHSANNLMVFQPTDGMAGCLLGQPRGVPYKQIWWVSQLYHEHSPLLPWMIDLSGGGNPGMPAFWQLVSI